MIPFRQPASSRALKSSVCGGFRMAYRNPRR
jgi:hypothetical protein